eukprot:1184275-Prorocentrum_minimum.AAC.7
MWRDLRSCRWLCGAATREEASKLSSGTARVPLIAAVCNSRVPVLAASEPTTVAAYPGDFGAFNSRCP